MMIIYKLGSIVEMRDVSTVSAVVLQRLRIAIEACGTYTVAFK